MSLLQTLQVTGGHDFLAEKDGGTFEIEVKALQIFSWKMLNSCRKMPISSFWYFWKSSTAGKPGIKFQF